MRERKYTCDKPMAEKKGMLPCKGQCSTCMCAIYLNEMGEYQHVELERPDPYLAMRNRALIKKFGGEIVGE